MPNRLRRVCLSVVISTLLCFGAQPARAHPLAQGRMQLVIGREKITLWASVSLEEVVVQQSLPSNDDGVIVTQSDAYRAHGIYLLKHIFLTADGVRLDGKVAGIQEPDNKTLTPGEPGKEYVVYELEYALAAAPANIALRQDVLLEVEYTPNNPWQSTYITGIRQGTAQGQENLLLSSANTLKYTCDWSVEPATAPEQTASKVNAPPAELSRAIPEAAPDRSHFVAGLAIGACAIYLLALIFKKLRR
jgi:hypothetical protein